MTKLLTALLVLAMAVHLIKPLNLPGLRRRPDFWRIAVIAFAIWTIANLLPRARSHHRWYRERFAEYPSERRAMIPFVF